MSGSAVLLLALGACLALTVYGLAAVTVAPLAVYSLLAGYLAGLVLGLTEAVRVLGGLVDTPRVRTPRDEFSGTGGGRSGSYRRDYAWGHYARRQAGYDLRHVAERCRSHVLGLWGRSWRALPRMPRYHLRLVDRDLDPRSPYATARSRTWTLLLGWPLLALPVAGLAGLTVGTVTSLALLALVVVLVAAPAWLLAMATGGMLRVADHRWRTSRGTDTCCPRCYFLIDLPEYRCPGDHPPGAPAGSERHRMLRPGLQGLWRRRCGCGTALPARLPAAGARLVPACPKCGTRLVPGSGRASEVRVAVFGAPDAGKTSLVDTMVAGLVALFQPDRCAVSRRTTSDPVRSEVVTVILRAHGADQRVQLFDAPGRGLVDRGVCRSYTYLDETRHFLFVLDPLSLEPVRRLMAEVGFRPAATIRVAGHDPIDSYEAVVAGLRYRGVDTGRCRLAFVVSKVDQLRLLPGGEDLRPESAAVRRWLVGQGLDHLLTAIARDFVEVGFFVAGRNEPASSEPLVWLLRGDRRLRREVARALR